MTHRSQAVLYGSALFGLLLSGCHRGGDTALPSRMPNAQVHLLPAKPAGDSGEKLVRQAAEDQLTYGASFGPETAVPSALTQWTSVDTLALTGYSPGLVVCEPVAVQADSGTTDFGAGCGRWLHLSVAGLPQMGQTPLWSSLRRAETELTRTDLRLTPTQAKQLSTILGVTHVATGQITGTAAQCTLTYQLFSVPSGTAVGPALTATGTSTQVLSQLPALARRMAAALGVSAPTLSVPIRAAPSEFGLLGRLDWYPDDTLPAAQTHQLQVMAARLPLAGLFLVNTTGDLTDAQWNAAVSALLAQNPDNALIWAQIGFSNPSLLALARPQLTRNLLKYPQNTLFAAGDTWMLRLLKSYNLERRAAEQTVQNAPRNPDGWLTLASTISEEGDRLRWSRRASEITPREWQFLNAVYPQWFYATSQAVRLDPLFGKAWDRVAKAATFADHPRQADQALWKDIALNKADPEAYAWGLQMYQSKWNDDPLKLRQVAQAIAGIAYPTVAQGLFAAKILRDNEGIDGQFQSERQALLTTLLARTQRAIAANPGDAQAHYDQAYALSLAGHKGEAITEYKNVALLRPTEAQSYFDIAQEYDQRERAVPAIAAYRQGLKLDPASAVAHYGLGWDLKNQGQLSAAEVEMRQAVKLAPFYPEAHAGLAQVLATEHRGKEATAQMLQAVQLNPSLMPAVPELCTMLDEQGRYVESLAMGRRAIELNPGDGASMDTMADDYLHQKLWANSIQMSQAALQVNANDPVAHENLGEAYIGQGRKEEAQSEWNKVLTLDHGPVAQAAREMLAKYP